jgi:hypothetical protein
MATCVSVSGEVVEIQPVGERWLQEPEEVANQYRVLQQPERASVWELPDLLRTGEARLGHRRFSRL